MSPLLFYVFYLCCFMYNLKSMWARKTIIFCNKQSKFNVGSEEDEDFLCLISLNNINE